MQMRELRARLRTMAEPEYQKFSSALTPGAGNMLGVRLPALRALAREIARSGDYAELLAVTQPESFEETMLQGMVIGCAALPLAERLELCAGFVPRIHNWAVCDSFCAGLKCAQKEPEAVFSFLVPYLDAPAPFSVRFAAVMLLDYFVNEAYIDRVLPLLAAVRREEYYVRMGVAWALSVCYIRFPERTLPVLAAPDRLDADTRRMTVQKICDSRRVPAADKAALRAMLRGIQNGARGGASLPEREVL